MPVERANDRVAHQVCLVRKEDKRQRDLRGVGAKVAPHTPEMAGPGNSARMNQ